MREQNGRLEGDQVVRDAVLVRGMIVGNVTVVAGGELVLRGIATKDLVIEEGGSASILGTVVGDVENAGTCVVAGRIRGRLLTEAAGRSNVTEVAVIEGGRIPRTG